MVTMRTKPSYLEADDLDTLARQSVQLMTELWIVKDRLFVLESMLEKAGIIDRTAFDGSEPDAGLSAELEEERKAYIKRIIGLPADQRTIENLQSVAPKRN